VHIKIVEAGLLDPPSDWHRRKSDVCHFASYRARAI
jgi:hypothetical protein